MSTATETFHEIPYGDEIERRRERVFLVLAGIFLGSMAMLNILGVTRFLDLSFELFGRTIPMPLAIGVLPYPITFLCTDFISEVYGRRRANFMVWVGFLINIWLIFILWLGGILPGFDQPVLDEAGRLPLFFEIRTLALGATAASMIAYLAAQLIDVHVFHFWKSLTKGRHLWLRNNGSTLVSQFVDSFAVITITHYGPIWAGAGTSGLPIDLDASIWPQLWTFILTAYVFKVAAALFDTIPFYLGTSWLRKYLHVSPGDANESDPAQREADS